MQIVPLSKASTTDLIVDSVYQGGRSGNASDDPLPTLLKVSNSGGFRYRGNLNRDKLELVVLKSSGDNPDWPDMLDRETGVYTYFGDNRTPGRQLNDTQRKGNKLLERIFNLAHSGVEGRRKVPPVLIFEKREWRDVVFLGLAVPGITDLRPSEDLVAVWRISNDSRFQNYRARFSILDESLISRAWIKDIIAGNPHSSNASPTWLNWVNTGSPGQLRATKSLEYRNKNEQLPTDPKKLSMLERIREYFRDEPHKFERCAVALARLLLPDIVDIEVTQRSHDGGRDAIGKLRIGNGKSAILVDFALEAKCYDVSTGVNVGHMSRLISRLRHRQFGILITTSYVNNQVYKEITEDQHPIIVVSGKDIVELLINNGHHNPDLVQKWLEQNFVE